MYAVIVASEPLLPVYDGMQRIAGIAGKALGPRVRGDDEICGIGGRSGIAGRPPCS
jgi:hypothetical protein